MDLKQKLEQLNKQSKQIVDSDFKSKDTSDKKQAEIWANEAYKYGTKYYEKTGEPGLKLSNYNLRGYLYYITNKITPYADVNFIDVSDIHDFSKLLPEGFKGNISKWSPKTVDSVREFEPQGVQTDFYHIAKKLSKKQEITYVSKQVVRFKNGKRKVERTFRSDTVSTAKDAAPSLNIRDMRDLKNYIAAYELLQDLLNNKPVSYDKLYDKLPQLYKRYYGKSPFVTQSIHELIKSNKQFRKNWMPKLLKCK